MKKIIFLFNLFVISAIYGDIYSDRMLVYIDNSITNFQVDEKTKKGKKTQLQRRKQEKENKRGSGYKPGFLDDKGR